MKLGRPTLSESEKKGQITGVRLRGEERKLLERAASHKSQTLSHWIREVLLSSANKQLHH
jgi:uncharacterized protein (DUF1778 family)